MPEEQLSEAEQKRAAEARHKMVTKISGGLAGLLQEYTLQEAPIETATDHELEEFLLAVQIALAQHLIATVLCYREEGVCLSCASHEALDEVLATYGGEILEQTTSPLTSVH